MPLEAYSALTAPTLWGHSLGLLLLAAVGGVLLWGSLRGKCWMRGMSGLFGVAVQFIVGAIFFSVPMYFNAHAWVDTFTCRNALREGDVTTVSGMLSIESTFEKPGFGYITFSIDGRSYTTHIAGKECDCGYIQAIGRTVERSNNQMVKAKIHGRVVLSLEQIR